jgi:Transglycosylase SLT domain
MSRIPAREVLLASGAVSAVASLCVLSGGSAAAQAGALTDSSAAYSQQLPTYYRDGHGAMVAEGATPSGSVAPVSSQSLDAARQLAQQLAYDFAQRAHASTLAPTGSTTPTHPAAVPTPSASPTVVKLAAGSPRATAQQMAAAVGWTGSQWSCLDALWQHESRYITTATNPSSGAYGIPQALPASKMATAGADWRTNPATQIAWGLSYIQGRYGTPCAAWSYWQRHGDY